MPHAHVRPTAWPARVLVGEFKAWHFVWLGYEDGDRCRTFWGLIRPRISGFFCQIDVGWAGDVVGGGIDGLPLIYQLD